MKRHRRLHPPKPATIDARRSKITVSEPEMELFLQAVEALERVPDKDAVTPPVVAKAPHLSRRPPRRAAQEPDCVLDLHGKRAEEARLALTHFMQRARYRGDRTVLVITGKGLRSPGGRSVIKEEVERWVRQEGAAMLETCLEAPRHLGGRGAYLLVLRR